MDNVTPKEFHMVAYPEKELNAQQGWSVVKADGRWLAAMVFLPAGAVPVVCYCASVPLCRCASVPSSVNYFRNQRQSIKQWSSCTAVKLSPGHGSWLAKMVFSNTLFALPSTFSHHLDNPDLLDHIFIAILVVPDGLLYNFSESLSS